jgi:nickel transport protein
MKKVIMILIGLGSQLAAHTLWIDDNYKVHQGHMHQESLKNSKHRVDKKEIDTFLCLKDNRVKKSHGTTLAKSGCDAIFVTLHSGYYTKTPYGIKKLPKDKTKMPIESWQSIESVKRLYSDNKTPYNQGLELFLRNNLSDLKVGDKARLTVYYNGKVMSGVVLANGHKTIGMSDKNGHVNIKIRHKGLQNIKASYTRKGDGVKCDKIIHTTTLNFKINP